METNTGFEVPDFGTIIERRRALSVYQAQRPALTLLCASAGYGKSVLASQFALHSPEDVLWLSSVSDDGSLERLLSLVAVAMSRCSGGLQAKPELGASLSRYDALVAIRDGFQERRSTSMCFVIDGCNRVESLMELQELLDLIRGATAQSSSLIVTCRSLGSSEVVGDAPVPWVLDELDLRFARDEIHSLAVLLGLSEFAEDLANRLSTRFGGHPALTALMLRHGTLDDIVEPPKDLIWYVDRLVHGLSQQALVLLYVASLLREDASESIEACVSSDPEERTWLELSALAPLISLDQSPPGRIRCVHVHAVLADSALRLATAKLGDNRVISERDRVLHHLASRNAYDRVHAILETACTATEIIRWCECCGKQILRFAGPTAVARLFQRIPPILVSGSPELLLLSAATLREQERFAEARAQAVLAAGLAEACGQEALHVRAVLLVARLDLDRTDFEGVRAALQPIEHSSGSLDPAANRLLNAYMAVVEAQSGKVDDALMRAGAVLQSIELIDDLGSDDAVLAVNCVGSVEGLCAGRWDNAARLLAGLSHRNDLSPLQRLQIRANLASCYVELGYASEAIELLDQVLADIEASGLQQLAAYAYGTRSSAKYALDDAVGGLEDYSRSEQMHDASSDHYVRAGERLSAAVARRAAGELRESLSLAEEAQLIAKHESSSVLLSTGLAELEIAASLLSMGGAKAAARMVEDVKTRFGRSGTRSYLLRADLVLAEMCRLEGQTQAAVDRLAPHKDYLLTGSANWLTAMYLRAFPGLLGILASAVGPEAVPLRMLSMVPQNAMLKALEMAEGYLQREDVWMLKQRRGTDHDSCSPPAPDFQRSSPPCHVRLFGGLEITTPLGVVDESSWRKRKARLLFLFLVLRRRQDVPRDVLLEQLWPEMDEEHAKRNFYVTWSTMKRALACGQAPAAAKSLVQCSAGVCRVTRDVRSDLDDFEECIAALRTAEVRDDLTEVGILAQRLSDLYRGELLPGDLYEEWLTDVRERVKHEFCDAMMLAAGVAETHGEYEEALRWLRRASAADPWREDVYQSTMRCQIGSGQRSRAIETYLSCRSRLTEDLGIDPSVETTKLYQTVLAMEDGL